jgi:hypothetical protein
MGAQKCIQGLGGKTRKRVHSEDRCVDGRKNTKIDLQEVGWGKGMELFRSRSGTGGVLL